MQNGKDMLMTMNDNLRRMLLIRMVERVEQGLLEKGNEKLAEELIGILNDVQREEQDRLDRKINVHVVFSSSGAGSVKVALSECEKRLESRVIQVDDFYSYGPILQLHLEQGRHKRERWMMERFNDRMYRLLDRENRVGHFLSKLSSIPENRRIYLWVGENAHDQVSARLAMYALRGKTNDIHILNVSQMYKEAVHRFEPKLEPKYVGHVPMEALTEMMIQFESAQPIDEKTKETLVRDWEQLSITTDTLRIWKNGEIVGLEEDAFDAEILNTVRSLQRSGDKENVKNGYVRAGAVVSELIERKIFESDRYIEYRLWHLISSGQLDFKGIPYALYLYSVKIP
ncbi:hypothetical protein J23TS9_11820 [Paenibacillus sp. J23TS9]|uniref:DUF1835 domain-containing protein n=1 Tax=Paenibacillus sp. J23TS9 TaxID=2807193 RepID=UPI001B159629|nr:DUF1835 domain-containing protein [Paenibacillus sp. J23TS9]GIP26052.1 hypothetical protein J23TS9_11820 [Paenibacillus sp. J23TS9]